LVIEFIGLDQTIADIMYQAQGNSWHLKNSWITAILIHKGGKYLSLTIALLVLLLWGMSYKFSQLKAWQYRLRYLFVTSVLGSLAVSIGKAITHISCPWDFSRYGGQLEYLSLIEQLSIGNGNHCFPAGHASAGYAWVALYFVGRHTLSSWRWYSLGGSLLVGLTFGFSQQLRGAHFISHDLWSFGICWIVSLISYYVMLKPYEPIS
jgi:membrane-associated PAP2 superfamily phosphatase